MALTYFSAKCHSSFSFAVVYGIENGMELSNMNTQYTVLYFFYIFPSKPNVIDLEKSAQGDFVSP